MRTELITSWRFCFKEITKGSLFSCLRHQERVYAPALARYKNRPPRPRIDFHRAHTFRITRGKLLSRAASLVCLPPMGSLVHGTIIWRWTALMPSTYASAAQHGLFFIRRVHHRLISDHDELSVRFGRECPISSIKAVFHDGHGILSRTQTSTLRFLRRPSDVSFEATGKFCIKVQNVL